MDFLESQVRDKYGVNGNVSIPPTVIMKMMILLVLYNVRSERELMATIPERLIGFGSLATTSTPRFQPQRAEQGTQAMGSRVP